MKRIILILALVLALGVTAVCAAEEAAPAEAADNEAGLTPFFETWVADQHSIEIYQEDDGTITGTVLETLSDAEHDVWYYKDLTYDAASGSLVCNGQGTKVHNTYSDDDEAMNSEELATGLSASFAIDADDRLIWTEAAENAGEGIAFVRLDVAEEEMGELRRLRLGSSRYVVNIDGSYIAGELTEEDVADDQVGYYASPNTLMDFDVYQIPKADADKQLSTYVIEEAARVGDVSEVRANQEINGVSVAWYRALENYQDVRYETVTYFMDDGDSYVKLVFWLDGDDAEGEVDAIIQSLGTIQTRELRVGTSPYFIKVLDSYHSVELTQAQRAENQVACWRSDEVLMDFDIYQFPKDGVAGELSQYVLEEAAKYETTSQIDTEYTINGIRMAWFILNETEDGAQYQIMNCVLDNGDDYVKIAFRMDGVMALEEVNAVIKSITKCEPMTVELGASDYTLTLPEGFRKGALKEADLNVGRVGYWYDVEGTLEIDVYQYPKADLEGTLADYLAEMAEGQEEAVNYDAEATVNDIPAAWCQIKGEVDDSEFNALTYILDSGEDYIEVSFWIKSAAGEETADSIIHTLA